MLALIRICLIFGRLAIHSFVWVFLIEELIDKLGSILILPPFFIQTILKIAAMLAIITTANEITKNTASWDYHG